MTATCAVQLPEGEPVFLQVAAAENGHIRVVVATRGEISFRDRLNTDSSIARDRFAKKLAAKLGVPLETLGPLDHNIVELAEQAGVQRPNGNHNGDRESQATIVANMRGEWDLWRSPADVAYVTFEVGDHSENWPVRSQAFKRYISKRFFESQGAALNSDAFSSAINLLEAHALFDGEEHDIHIRLAEHEGAIYLDLCNSRWQVVEITPSGWRVMDESPVRFRRSRGMLPLPIPQTGGNIEDLREFLNVNDNSWRLIIAWLISALRPRGPYPLLALCAEQGSGKSVAGRLIRALVDPNSAPLRSEPRDARDLMISANNSWCLAFDNLSYIPNWFSDALCRMSTGGGFATRELYTDQDEIIFDSQRPVLLTSIDEVATRSDLLDRCLVVWLPAIPEDERRREEEIEQAFNELRPLILGVLLDVVSGALRDLPEIQLDALPRMADFALWASAAEGSLGWQKGTFMEAYRANQASANEVALESSPVGPALLDLLGDRGGWHGTATDLLEAIELRVSDPTKRLRTWPKNGRSMAGHLGRLAPNLRAAGWEVDYHRGALQRTWTLRPKTDSQDHTDIQDDLEDRVPEINDADDVNEASSVFEWEEGVL